MKEIKAKREEEISKERLFKNDYYALHLTFKWAYAQLKEMIKEDSPFLEMLEDLSKLE